MRGGWGRKARQAVAFTRRPAKASLPAAACLSVAASRPHSMPPLPAHAHTHVAAWRCQTGGRGAMCWRSSPPTSSCQTWDLSVSWLPARPAHEEQQAVSPLLSAHRSRPARPFVAVAHIPGRRCRSIRGPPRATAAAHPCVQAPMAWPTLATSRPPPPGLRTGPAATAWCTSWRGSCSLVGSLAGCSLPCLHHAAWSQLFSAQTNGLTAG